MTDAAQRARCLLQAGGYSPIPVVGKVPALMAWQKHTQTNPAEIELWHKLYPDAVNTGILTAYNPTVDVDLLGEEAAEAIEELARERFGSRGPVLSRVGRWPKRAILLRCDVPFKKMTRSLVAGNGTAEKLEVLCEGQQVVVHGIHPDTKAPYLWFPQEPGQEPGQVPWAALPLVRAEELQAFLDEAVALLVRDFGYKVAGERPKPTSDRPNGNGAHHGGSEDWEFLFNAILQGQDLHDSAAALALKLTTAGMGGGTAVNVLRALHDMSSAPRDSRFEERYADIPRAVTSAERKQPRPEVGARRYKLIRARDLHIDRQASFTVKGIVPRVGLVVVWGVPKSGKSFWATDISMHVAMGREYRGHRVQAGVVVYCAFEGQAQFPKRMEALRLEYGAEAVDAAPFYLMPVSIDLIANHGALLADIKAQAPTPMMVVLDTLNRSLVGSESKDEDMGAYIKAADAIREAFGCVVMIVHHCGVDGTRPRGHSSLSGADDAQIAIKRDDGKNVVMTIEHMKDGPEGEVLVSQLKSIDLGVDSDGDAITSCVVVPVDGDAAPARKKLSAQGRFHLSELHNCLAENGRVVVSTMIPRDTKSVDEASWRARCYASSIADKPETKRKAFTRAVGELRAAGVIGVWEDRVWVAELAGTYWHEGRSG